jgi:hypothetical protein
MYLFTCDSNKRAAEAELRGGSGGCGAFWEEIGREGDAAGIGCDAVLLVGLAGVESDEAGLLGTSNSPARRRPACWSELAELGSIIDYKRQQRGLPTQKTSLQS